MTHATRSQLGWRALAGIGACGALVGFAIPAIASSLIRRERQQPSVRLLPAPRLPETGTGTSTTPPARTLPSVPARRLRPGATRAERAARRRPEQITRAVSGRRIAMPVPQASAPGGQSDQSPAPATHQSPSGSGHQQQAGKAKPTPVGSNGGSEGPG